MELYIVRQKSDLILNYMFVFFVFLMEIMMEHLQELRSALANEESKGSLVRVKSCQGAWDCNCYTNMGQCMTSFCYCCVPCKNPKINVQLRDLTCPRPHLNYAQANCKECMHAFITAFINACIAGRFHNMFPFVLIEMIVTITTHCA